MVWQKGQTGNKNGSKKPRIWSAAVERALAKNDYKKLDECAEALIAKAKEGDVAALKELGDRLEGKSVQAIDATVTTETWEEKLARLSDE